MTEKNYSFCFLPPEGTMNPQCVATLARGPHRTLLIQKPKCHHLNHFNRCILSYYGAKNATFRQVLKIFTSCCSVDQNILESVSKEEKPYFSQ